MSSPKRAGIEERYALEWLEQQAVAGLLEVEDLEAGAADARATGSRPITRAC